MVAPTFRFSPAVSLTEPFEIAREDVGTDAGLVDVLGFLSPRKRAFRSGRSGERVVLDLEARSPFGPTATQVADLVFPEGLEAGVAAVQGRFSVPVVVKEAGRSAFSKSEDARSLEVDVYEFCQLASAARTGTIAAAALVSIFLDPDSVYALHVPKGRLLGDVLESVPAVHARLSGQRDAGLFHPVKRVILGRDEPCGERADLVCVMSGGYDLLADASWLRPFPFFSRALRMGAAPVQSDGASPCINCLACAKYCPSRIRPSLIHHSLSAGDREEAAALGMDRCVQCGWCSYLCPSRLPLYEQIANATAEMAAEKEGASETTVQE